MTLPPSSDLIVAESTPRGRGGISIVRLSGPDALGSASTFVRFRGIESHVQVRPRFAYLVDVLSEGVRVDEALLLYFEGPASFTGEDVVELHLHGNPNLVDLVLREAVVSGGRLAEAGEFTQRAFAGGRLDLTQVDALGGLLAAEQKVLFEAAAGQLGGSLRDRLLELRERVLSILASLELGLDFVEEGYDFVDVDRLVESVVEISSLVDELRRTYQSQAGSLAFPLVCLYGAPNAGKSTLFNALVGFERSITHEVPGTTRDYVSEVVEIDGFRFRLVDTAGIRETSDVVEERGVGMVRQLVADADLVISLVDGTLSDWSLRVTQQLNDIPDATPVLTLLTRADSDQFVLFPEDDMRSMGDPGQLDGRSAILSHSSFIRSDVSRLASRIRNVLRRNRVEIRSVRYIVSERQNEVLLRFEGALAPLRHLAELSVRPSSDTDVSPDFDPVLIAGDLRRLLPLFGELVGEATNEDVLDRVFGQFCIGK